MMYSKRNGISHREWFVRAVDCGAGFCFCCSHPHLGKHTNITVYPTEEAAIIAGCQFIDREQAIALLGQLLDEWVSTDKITLEEYWKVSSFCGSRN